MRQYGAGAGSRAPAEHPTLTWYFCRSGRGRNGGDGWATQPSFAAAQLTAASCRWSRAAALGGCKRPRLPQGAPPVTCAGAAPSSGLASPSGLQDAGDRPPRAAPRRSSLRAHLVVGQGQGVVAALHLAGIRVLEAPAPALAIARAARRLPVPGRCVNGLRVPFVIIWLPVGDGAAAHEHEWRTEASSTRSTDSSVPQIQLVSARVPLWRVRRCWRGHIGRAARVVPSAGATYATHQVVRRMAP